MFSIYYPDNRPLPKAKKKLPKKSRAACQYNNGVLCDDRNCDGCGFNPNNKRGEAK